MVLCVQVVARVQGLTMLNGSAVRQRERRDCELRYLRAITGMLTLICPCMQTKALIPGTGLPQHGAWTQLDLEVSHSNQRRCRAECGSTDLAVLLSSGDIKLVGHQVKDKERKVSSIVTGDPYSSVAFWNGEGGGLIMLLLLFSIPISH